MRATRGFLVVSGTMAKEHVTIIVNHLPSRGATSYYREEGGSQLRVVKDSLIAEDPDVKLFIMGDMNDDPKDPSMSVALGAKRKIEDATEKTDLFNPWWDIHASGTGTLMYGGADYLFQQEGKYKGNTLRTHAGGVWLDGYSDHLPTLVYLVKEQK